MTDTMTLFVGFAALAGLTLGYGSARFGPLWLALTLWALAIGGVVATLAWVASRPAEAALDDGLLLAVGAVIPFAGCVIVSGVIGLTARRILARGDAE